MYVLADTRIRAVVNSPRGSMLFVPRESGMVRIGVKLDMLDRTQVTPETILAAARHIIAPFRLDYTHCDWYAVYQSNQRLADHFTVKDRVMICGDACHTHSPKAGIGMNFSIQDSKQTQSKAISQTDDGSRLQSRMENRTCCQRHRQALTAQDL